MSRVRLAVIAELVTAEWVTFSDLQRSVKATNGNLGAHLAKLVTGGHVTEQKLFERRRAQSRHRLTGAGRASHVSASFSGGACAQD